MNKTLTYSGFAISTLLVILAFVTAKTYTQLVFAVVAYPLLAYFALKLFPRVSREGSTITVEMPIKPVRVQQVASEPQRPKVDVADIDKRTFLKLVGTAGISFFIFSLLGRRVESLLFGETSNPALKGLGGIPDGGVNTTNITPTEGYKISEIDDSGIVTYYGFINKNSAWLIMKEETDSGSFRYAKGGSNFPVSWTDRENIKYDYFYNLF